MSVDWVDYFITIGSDRAMTSAGIENAKIARYQYNKLTAELEAARAELAEYRTVRPVRCDDCRRGFRLGIEAAATFADDFDGDDLGFDLPTSIGAGIRALQPPTDCAGCNPLEPEAVTEDEKVFGCGAWVYCSQHCKPHQTGWCTVSARDKIGLGVDSAEAALNKCYDFGLRIHNAK